MDGAGLGRTAVVRAAEHASHATEAAASEELGEEILSGHAAVACTAFEAGLTILVINLSLLRVGKNVVGLAKILELFLGVGVAWVFVCTDY